MLRKAPPDPLVDLAPGGVSEYENFAPNPCDLSWGRGKVYL